MGYSRTYEYVDDVDLEEITEYRVRERRAPAKKAKFPREGEEAQDRRAGRRAARSDRPETFRCRHCKMLVGPTLSGGKHRNHCPVCLYSRHVDGKTPGDRASDCRSLMEPIGLIVRRSGEQAILHRCLGCGFERHNRVAADDSIPAVMRLPIVELQSDLMTSIELPEETA